MQRYVPKHVWLESRRHYDTPAGTFPGVTTVLKATKSEEDRAGLARWKQRVGVDEFNRVGDEAAARGTTLHEGIERFLADGTESTSEYWPSVRPFVMSIKPLLVEGAVWHPLGFAGCVDCVAEVDGVKTIVDWKTASRPKRTEWIGDYFLQVAAYCAAVNRVYSAKICHGLVVVALTDRPAQVFSVDPVKMAAYWRQFQTRLSNYKALPAAKAVQL